ncbi:MAG: tetratricopeptide repeat protein [Candidatus Stahlbacteria bacterium]|nr:tetratricopeptide repeat protein [Candidatus Stahlbacteria bacterium]
MSKVDKPGQQLKNKNPKPIKASLLLLIPFCKGMGLIVIIFVPLMGCAVRDYFKEKNRQLNDIDESNQRIESRILEMDSISKAQVVEQKEGLDFMRAETITKLSDLENRVSSVDNKLTDLQSLLYKKSAGTTESDTAKKLDNIYNIAYSDFIKGNYELALVGFRQFLTQLQNADNTYYWIGECYYAMEDYPNATAVFKNVTDNYPMSKKAPTALYKLITIYNIKQDTLNMQEYLKKLTDTYPDSPEAKLLAKPKSDNPKPNTEHR